MLVLVGCASPTPTLQPTLTVWRVQITPALGWLHPAINRCVQADPSTGVFLVEITAVDIDFSAADVTLTWGISPAADLPVFELGSDHLSVIVHPENEITSLTAQQFAAIINGEITTWQQVDAQQIGDIAWWTYPAGDEGLVLLESATGAQPSRNPFAWLAPDAGAVLQSVAQDTAAMGFIPSRWMNGSVKSITIDGLAEEEFTRPILAVTNQAPQPMLTAFLQCLQGEITR